MKTLFPPRSRILALAIIGAGACVLTIGAQEEPGQLPDSAGLESKANAELKATLAEVRAAIAELSDDDFRTRETATIKLWRIGDKAEPYISEAANTDNLEVRIRAKRMLNLFKYGIYPDTPAEVIALINQFRHGNLNSQTTAIQQLYSLGSMGTVAKLIRSIDDETIRRRLVNAVVNKLDEKLAEKFAEEKYDDVEALLKLAAISDAGLRDLAAFYLQRGSLEDEIGRLLKQEKEDGLESIDYEQLSWFHRVNGDLTKALIAARSAGSTDLERDIRIAQGDLLELIKASHNPNDRTIQTYGFKAAAERLSGDTDGFAATIKTIKEYAADNPGEERQCLEALLINGRIADAIEVAQVGGNDRIQLLIDNGDHAQALAELGIKNPKPPYNDWLDGVIKEFAAAETQTEYSTSLGKAYTLARLLGGWGEDAEAERIFDKLGQVASELKPEFLPRFIANASVLNLHKIALKYTRAAFAKEAADAAAGLDLPGVDPAAERVRNRVGQRGAEESLIGGLYYNQASTASFLWEHFQSKFPDDSGLQRLQRIETLIAPLQPGQDPQDQKSAAIELLAQLVPKADDPMDDEDKVALLTNLSELYLRHDDRPSAMELLRQTLLFGREDLDYANIAYAQMLAEDGTWEESLIHFKSASESTRGNSSWLVLYAIALERVGKQDEAAPLLKRAYLQALGRPIEYMLIASAFAEFDEYERAREASQTALNIATIADTSIHREAIRLADYLLYHDDARAAMYKERYLIECLKGHVPLPRITNAPSIRASIGTINARIAIRENRTDEAVGILRDLVDRQPSNSSIVEDLYPILVQAGRKKDADEFYEKLNRYGENALALFPNSAQDLNSNAWLKARCGKDLDTALARSELSNKLSQDNYAYLDTLAEVYFQRGDRKQAVELSEQAVKLAGSDLLLHKQLQRFKSDKPLSELLAE